MTKTEFDKEYGLKRELGRYWIYSCLTSSYDGFVDAEDYTDAVNKV